MITLFFGDEIRQALLDMFFGMVGAIPKIITALILIVVGSIVAKAIRSILTNALTKMAVDTFGNKINDIDILAKNNIQIKLSAVIGKIVYFMIMLIFVMAAVGSLDMPVLAELIKDFIKFVPNLIAAFVILIAGILLADTLKNVVTSTCKSLGMSSANIIGSVVFYFIMINILIVALTQAGINAGFFAQNISIIVGGCVLAFSIGYGFASKDLVASFLASYYTKDKINIGDKISINNITGTVIAIDKSSVVVDSGDRDVIIPLNKILNDNIEIYH
jgi:Mechanosensitive ion channel/Conserved TM helix